MGDSITQHIFKNLICTLAIAAKPLDVDTDVLGHSVRVRYRDTELELLAGGNPQLWGNNTRNLSRALPSVVSRLKPGDIAIINAGVHWNGEEQIRQEVGALATAVATAQRSSRGLALWLETPPQHFPTTTGLHEPLRNDGTNPILSPGGCAILNTSTSHFKPQANLRNIVAEDALRPANVRIIRVWKELLPLHEHHCTTIDCTHWSRTVSQRLGDAVLNAISIHCPRITTQS